MAWVNVCKLIKYGGLNIFNLEVWNKVTLLKSLWNICLKMDNLRVKWLHDYYLKGQDLLAEDTNKICTWILRSIMDRKADIDSIFNV